MLLLMVGTDKVTLNKNKYIRGSKYKKIDLKKWEKMANNTKKNQFHPISIKCFGHKHNRML